MPRGKHKLLPPATGNKGPRWTPLDRAFLREYFVDMNATRAFIRAGGAERSAYTHGPKMLRKPHVKAAIEAEAQKRDGELKAKSLRVAQVTYDRGVVDPAEAFDAQGEPLPLHLMPQDLRRAVQSVKIEYVEQAVVTEDGRPAVSDTGKPVVLRTAKVVELKLHDTKPDRELFLKYAGRLKDKVEHDVTDSFADLVLGAQRERTGK